MDLDSKNCCGPSGFTLPCYVVIRKCLQGDHYSCNLGKALTVGISTPVPGFQVLLFLSCPRRRCCVINYNVEYRNRLVGRGGEFDFECLEPQMLHRALFVKSAGALQVQSLSSQCSREEEGVQGTASVAEAGKFKYNKEQKVFAFGNGVNDDRVELANSFCQRPDGKYFRP